jgi:hypothetical protein
MNKKNTPLTQPDIESVTRKEVCPLYSRERGSMEESHNREESRLQTIVLPSNRCFLWAEQMAILRFATLPPKQHGEDHRCLLTFDLDTVKFACRSYVTTCKSKEVKPWFWADEHGIGFRTTLTDSWNRNIIEFEGSIKGMCECDVTSIDETVLRVNITHDVSEFPNDCQVIGQAQFGIVPCQYSLRILRHGKRQESVNARPNL